MIHQLQTARRILADWVGEGGEPVPIEQAQERANVCLCCPFNFRGKWLWSLAARIAIASQERLRAAMKRRVNGEKELGVCDACHCYLKLKVHVPFKHIAEHTSTDEFAKLPANCWQLKELNKNL